jgi:hypothetical protein
VSPKGHDQAHAVAKVANVTLAPEDYCVVAIIPADAESMLLRETLDKIA